jgi:hypothetical protein
VAYGFGSCCIGYTTMSDRAPATVLPGVIDP